MMKYKTIIIGCGKIAGLYDNKDDIYIYSHAKAYSLNKNILLEGCSDLNLDNARALANKYNISNIDVDYFKMIFDIKPDIISICTPDKTHYDIVLSILDSKNLPKIIFLEKPACQNQEELNKLISLSEEKNVQIIINHSRRFDTLHKELKSKIEDGLFGKLIKTDAIYYGGWQHNGVHMIDTLYFLFSDTLIFEKLLNMSESPYKNDFNLDFKCKFQNSRALVYLTTMDEKYYQLFEFDFKFEKARIRLEDFGQRIVYEEKKINSMNENILIKKELLLTIDNKTPMETAVNRIVDYLRYNKPLKGYLINDISQTMKTIWDGTRWVK